MSNSMNATALPGTGKRIALVVGVNNVPNSILPSLSYAIADAESMADVLKHHCDFELLVPPLLGEHATSANVKRAVLNLARDRIDGDFLLLYFSGHGQQMIVESNSNIPSAYLGTADFDDRDVDDDHSLHVSMHWLRDKLFKGTQAGCVLIILDCCYAEDIRTGSDHSLDTLRRQIAYYFEIPGAEVDMRRSGLKVALAASGYDKAAGEVDGHGKMTKLLLQALRGEVDGLLGNEGHIMLDDLLAYIKTEIPLEQKPVISIADSTGKECILASYPKSAALLHDKKARVSRKAPRNYIPFPRNPLFQARPGEFERLESILFGKRVEQKPVRLGLVGLVGLGGIGKTQLAIQLAYRYEAHFPSGIYWMLAKGTTLFEWQHQLAELAANTEYLPFEDDVSHPENEVRRARHFCRYLADHADALLILDHVEDPTLEMSILSALAGGEVACTILYTSRITYTPPGVMIHFVEELPEEGAVRLLLETTRPSLLSKILVGSQDSEANAARAVCRGVGYLPLALVHLRSLLVRDHQVTLVRLFEVLRQRGILEITKTQFADAAPLFATFWLSWEKVRDERAQRLFKLAAYFPEAVPIPLWLLGLAAGLGDSGDIFEPLGMARMQLLELSLLEELSGDQVRLHPLVREFGRLLVIEDIQMGSSILVQAGERLIAEFTDLNRLERRALREGYWRCLEQTRATREYAELLATGHADRIGQIERWLDRESYLLGNGRWWPTILPGLLYQQLSNRSLEEGQTLLKGESPSQWLRQLGQVGAEDRSLLRIFPSHVGVVTSVAFSPDGELVLTGSSDFKARIWETVSGKLLITLEGHSGRIRSVAFSPDGSQVLTGSSDRTARLWETSTGKPLILLEGHTDYVTSVAFSPDGSQVLTGSQDGTARLWETMNGHMLVAEEHNDEVRSVAFSPDGKEALIGSSDGTARIWEIATRKLLMTLEGHSDGVWSVTFSPDGKLVLTGSSDGTARLWEKTTGQSLTTFEGYTNVVESVAFSPDGELVLTGSSDGTARLWEATTGKLLATLEGHTDVVESVAFSPDGTHILTGSWDKTARLWKTASKQVLATLEGHTGWVRSVAFSPDGTHILTGSWDKTARLWETASKQVLATLEGHTGWVRSVVFSPDGKQILTGSSDRTARLWEAATGKLLATLKGHIGEVGSVVFSPDGKQILTGSQDETARVWEATTGKLLATLKGHTGEVRSIAFSPDGRLMITCDQHGQVFVWNVDGVERENLLGGYVTTYEVGAIYWLDKSHVILVDMGGTRFRPHFYQLKLEGME
ncbi:caspase family protein [Reticulibacter mediterranei]|nr:caspase family protein [Reticulibacter mediterranei]